MIVSHSALAFLQESYKDFAMRFLIELQLKWFTTYLYLWRRGELNSVASGGSCHFPTLCSWVLERLYSLWLNWVVVQFLRKIRILQSTDPNNWWTDPNITHISSWDWSDELPLPWDHQVYICLTKSLCEKLLDIDWIHDFRSSRKEGVGREDVWSFRWMIWIPKQVVTAIWAIWNPLKARN